MLPEPSSLPEEPNWSDPRQSEQGCPVLRFPPPGIARAARSTDNPGKSCASEARSLSRRTLSRSLLSYETPRSPLPKSTRVTAVFDVAARFFSVSSENPLRNSGGGSSSARLAAKCAIHSEPRIARHPRSIVQRGNSSDSE